MTTTIHKNNPFGLLEHSDDDDDEGQVKTNKPKKPQPPKDKEIKSQPQANKQKFVQEDSAPKKSNENKKAAPFKGPTQESGVVNKDQHLKPKADRKLKGVPAEPHPLDRKSGTGQNPWDKKAKRGGGGKFNTGTVNDDLKAGEEPESANKEEGEGEEAEKDTGMTLAEYYQKTGQADQTEEKVAIINESKAKVTQQELLKDLGKVTKVSNRVETKIDDRELGPTKKANPAETHAVAMNTEHASLLGFKTGFKTYTERKPFDAQDKSTTKPGQTQGAPVEGTQAQQPELKEVNPPVQTEKGSEQQAPVEGGDQKQGGYGGRGGYKGKSQGRGGYNPNYKGRSDNQQKKDNNPPRFDDDGAFPKLG